MTEQTPETPPVDPSYLNPPLPAPPPSQVELARQRAAQAAENHAYQAGAGDTPQGDPPAPREDHP
jgi:hypothetical protein